MLFVLLYLYTPIITLSIINKIAPGTPSIPTNIAVTTFNPIWKLSIVPTKFIIYISTPPSAEFNTSFNILFIGTINILPKINKKIIHAIYIIRVFVSKINPPVLIFNTMI